MKYIIDLPDNCSWVQWIMTSDKDGHAYFDFKSPEDLTPLNKALEEAYQKGFEAGQHEATTLEYQQGFEDGKARNENRCVGCKYDNGRIDHSPCDYCCNAYSNQWMAKEKSDEIKIGDEVTPKSNDSNWLGVVVGVDDTNAMVMTRDGYTAMYRLEILKKTDKHFSQVAELLKVMKEGAE